MSLLNRNNFGLLGLPNVQLTTGINPNAQMPNMGLQQPIGGYGQPTVPMTIPTMPLPQPQQPTTFAGRLDNIAQRLLDYNIGRNQAGKASLDPSSGDAGYVNAMGFQNMQNQARARNELANTLRQQQIANQVSFLNQMTKDQKNFAYRESLPDDQKESFDKLMSSSSFGGQPSSVKEHQFFMGLPKKQQDIFLNLKRQGYRTIDTGQDIKFIDPQGEIVKDKSIEKTVTPENLPENIIQKKQAEALGKELGNLKLQYPAIKADLRDKIQTIDRILNYKDLDLYLGAIQGKGLTPAILDSERQDFLADLEKITSQEFLAQFGKLRGGGSITEAEGAKATSASTTLRPTLSEKRFREELKRLKEVAELGVQRKYGQIKSIESGNFDIDTPSKANQELFYNQDTGELLDSEGQIVK